jgi:hypothetical protein
MENLQIYLEEYEQNHKDILECGCEGRCKCDDGDERDI